MRVRVTVPEEHVSPEVIDPVLESVTRLNEVMLRNGQTPTASELARQGAVWKPEPPGDEHFDHGGTIASRGWGDCDDWAPLRAAELRTTGEDPKAYARVIPSGPNTYHAIVQRSDGSIDDPSVAAGMKPLKASSVIGGDGTMQVYVCDPHDGNVYTGALAPTHAPLSLHCGPTFSVRGVMTPGGPYFEGRCDVPIAGSRLVAVRAYARKPVRHHRRRHVAGALPYAISCIGAGGSPAHALGQAFVGAWLLGEAGGLTSDLDQYKVFALHAAMQGATPGQVRSMLVDKITHDVQAKAQATGTHPAQHTNALAEALHAQGVPVLATGIVVGDFFSDIGHIASGIVSSVSDAANAVANVAKQVPWGDILHGTEALVSAVPGLGTAVSDVMAAAETAYDSVSALASGHPLEAAVDAAYNFALASIPGASSLHPVLDPIKTTLMNIVDKNEPVDQALLQGLLSSVPDSPKVGPLSPKTVAASLAKIVTDHLGLRTTGSQAKAASKAPAVRTPSASPHAPRKPGSAPPRAAPPRAPRPAPPVTNPVARSVLAIKPPGTPHASVHKDAPVMPGSPTGRWILTPHGAVFQ